MIKSTTVELIIDIVLIGIAVIMAILAATCLASGAWIYLWGGDMEFKGRLFNVGLSLIIVDCIYVVLGGFFRACPPIGYGGDGYDEE